MFFCPLFFPSCWDYRHVFNLFHHGFTGMYCICWQCSACFCSNFHYINLSPVFFFFQWLIAFSQWTHLLLFLACLKCLYSFVTIPSSLCFISLLCNFMMRCLWLQAIGQNQTTCTSLQCTPWMLILTCTPFTLKSLKLLIMEVKSQSYFNPLSLLKEMFRPDCKKVATQGCERLTAVAPD